MNVLQEDSDDVIESSQAPVLRSKVRNNRVNYKGMMICSPKRSRGRPKRVRTRPKKPSPGPSKPVTELQDYFLFNTQPEQNEPVQPMASVSLFDQREHVLERYFFNQVSEAQVDQELQELLDGFRASYEQEAAKVANSPCLLGDAAIPLQPIPLPTANVETVSLDRLGNRSTSTLISNVGEHFIMPSFSEEIARLEEIAESRTRSSQAHQQQPAAVASPFAMPVAIQERTPRIPPGNENIPPMEIDNCLDLSIRRDRNDTSVITHRDAARDAAVFETPQSKPPNLSSGDPGNVNDAVLDLTIYHTGAPRHTTTSLDNTLRKRSVFDTTDTSTQTVCTKRFRNAGIQHRPVASFDFTVRNILILAQSVGADPALLYRNLKQTAQTSGECIWRERDLSHAFTSADPYFANLGHFL